MGTCTSRENTFHIGMERKSFIKNGHQNPNKRKQRNMVQMTPTPTSNQMQIESNATNTRITCTNPGNMNISQRNLILNALIYCVDEGEMTIYDIKKELNNKGMNCMVIQDKKGTSYVTYRNGMKWSSWKLPYGKWSIIVLYYIDDNDNKIIESVRDKDSRSSCESQSVVLAALGYCTVMKTDGNNMESSGDMKMVRI